MNKNNLDQNHYFDSNWFLIHLRNIRFEIKQLKRLIHIKTGGNYTIVLSFFSI